LTRSFVTGGSGFIGGALVSRLAERGDEVVALARSSAGRRRAHRARRSGWCAATSSPRPRCRAGMEGCDEVFHVAGMNTHCPRDPALLLRVNVEGTEAAVRAALRRASGGWCSPPRRLARARLPAPSGGRTRPHRGTYLSVYERSKRLGEDAAFAAARDRGLELVAVNPSSVQGPGARRATARSSSTTSTAA
jgi:dihydroflavonol-4-reductase